MTLMLLTPILSITAAMDKMRGFIIHHREHRPGTGRLKECGGLAILKRRVKYQCFWIAGGGMLSRMLLTNLQQAKVAAGGAVG